MAFDSHFAELAAACGGAVRIIGCGRPLRRDDQLGLRVAEMLMENPPNGATIGLCETPVNGLFDALSDPGLVILVDAQRARPGDVPGTIHRFRYRPSRSYRVPQCELEGPQPRATLSSNRSGSSHEFGLADAIALTDSLGVLGCEVWLYTAAVADFGFGEELSAVAVSACANIADEIHRAVGEWTSQNPATTGVR